MTQTRAPIDVRSPVADALQAGRPVVAMGSAPLAHTLPWPANVEAYRRAETDAQHAGATLAVVGVWQGRLTVGLSAGEIEALGKGASALRASRRDLPKAVVGGLTAATTVSASIYLAWRAGIRVLATSAIGGAARSVGSVHEHVWDISADLVEVAYTPVAVVSAGARSVHNLAYTAEVLETFRVPVVGYGTDLFPSFYMRAGNLPVPARADSPAEVAALLKAHWSMDGAGVVVAHPTPVEAALSPDELLPALHAVETQAARDHIGIKHLSPFLMEKLNRLTYGKALRAYQSILAANARLGAQIAGELQRAPTLPAAGPCPS